MSFIAFIINPLGKRSFLSTETPVTIRMEHRKLPNLDLVTKLNFGFGYFR